jgi:hypothetical protein
MVEPGKDLSIRELELENVRAQVTYFARDPLFPNGFQPLNEVWGVSR